MASARDGGATTCRVLIATLLGTICACSLDDWTFLAGTDGSMRDASLDGARDAGNGSGMDSGTDAGADAGMDSGTDAAPAEDASRDAGPRCAPRPTGDPTWPEYRLPGPSPRSYQVTGSGAEATVIDCVTGLEWQQAVDSRTFTQAAAVAYCAAVTTGGFDDWRLPATIELMTLVDYAIASPGPMIDATAFPSTPTTAFWTSSPRAGSPGSGWYVNFSNGYALYVGVTAPCRARCVR